MISGPALWLEQLRLLLAGLLFFVVHALLHVLDATVIHYGRILCRFTTAKFGFPRPGWIASAAPLTRRSQRESVVEIHVESPANAQSWFGWPVVVPQTACDENSTERFPVVTECLPVHSHLYTNHVSTIAANFKPVPKVVYRREIVQSYDGCDLAVDWAYPEDNTHMFTGVVAGLHKGIAGIARAFGFIDETYTRFGIPPLRRLDDKAYVGRNHTGVMTLVPGLMSTSSTTYIRSFVRIALSHGFVVALVHQRGLGTPLTRPKLFHGGFTEDVRHWVYTHMTKEALAKRFGRPTQAVIVGFSIGANILANFLAEDGDRVRRDSAIVTASCVSAPWRFQDLHGPMQRFVQRMTYDQDFRRDLVQYLRDNEGVLRDPATGEAPGFDFEAGLRAKNVAEFDHKVVMAHHGFDDPEEFYETISCFKRLNKISMPVVCVGVADDPICPPPAPDDWKRVCAETPNIAYAELPCGGHLGCLMPPLMELTMQPTPIEALVCRSMAHYLVNSSQQPPSTGPSTPN